MDDINTLLPDIKLRFSIQHPTLEDCYMFGYECAQNDVGEESNPFRLDSIEGEQWMEGWWDGFYGEDPVFSMNESNAESKVVSLDAANDVEYHEIKESIFAKVLELSGAIAVSAMIGYQLIDLVA